LNLPSKAKLYFLLPCREKLWNLSTKAIHIDLFCRSEKLWNLPTKATQINCTLFRRQKHCILFSRAATNFGIDQQKKPRLIVFTTLEGETRARRKRTGANNERDDNIIGHSEHRRPRRRKIG
jgi:hypothetical protein